MADPILVTESNTVLAVTEAGGSVAVEVVESPVVVSEIASGEMGPAGRTILSGSVDPTTEGEAGDFYINTTTYKIFGPKTTVWGDGVSLIGPAGDGSGDVVGPASATDGHIAVFDGATGKLIKSAGVAPYSLPTASDTVLGGVKVGSGLSIEAGVLSAAGGSGGTDAATVNSLVFAQTY